MSLRELLQHVDDKDDCITTSPAVYALLKALVEAVESEDTDATIRKLRSELEDDAYWNREASVESVRTSRRYWKKRCLEAERLTVSLHRTRQSEFDEARAEIERLRGQCEAEELCKGYLGLCTEAEAVVKSIKADADLGFAKAKAEIEKWRKSAQVYRDRYILALNDRDVAQAELEIKNEDAEKWQLVRGMENDTGLGWEDGLYYVLRCHYPGVGCLAWYRPESGAYSEDPAEVLRSIQEVGDAEG